MAHKHSPIARPDFDSCIHAANPFHPDGWQYHNSPANKPRTPRRAETKPASATKPKRAKPKHLQKKIRKWRAEQRRFAKTGK